MERRKLNHRPAVFVDVDGTLLLHRSKRINKQLLARIEERQGKVDFVLWSARGRKYAEAFARTAGIEKLFVAIVPKPTCIVDDLGSGWDRCIAINAFE